MEMITYSGSVTTIPLVPTGGRMRQMKDSVDSFTTSSTISNTKLEDRVLNLPKSSK